MAIAKVTEITASSTKSFEDAIKQGIARADKTLDKVKGSMDSRADSRRRWRQDLRVSRQHEGVVRTERLTGIA